MARPMSEEKNEMPQAAELKPCPFCGEGPTIRYVGDEDGGYHEVACYTPHAKDKDASLFCGVHASTEAEAIAAWNRRSPPSPSGRDEIRREALEEAAQVAELAHMVPPDGGSPTEDERRVAEAAASAIRSLMGNKQDLGSGFALGGLGETPSDALEAARRILDVVDDAERTYYPFHTRDYETIARALLAASPSPWRDMEEDELARAENARGSPAAAPTANIIERLREYHRDMVEMDNGECGATALYREAADEIEQLRADKDSAYQERNQVVAALASVFPSGISRTDIPGWLPEWHRCVYIDLPTGQASWHYHDSQHDLFAHLPTYTKEWDGHTTPQKYERLSLLAIKQEGAASHSPEAQSAVGTTPLLPRKEEINERISSAPQR